MAKLAKLKITEAQAQEYSLQMTNILKHFEQISKIETKGVEPLITPSEIEPYWRPDEIKREFTAEQMTENAPLKAGNLFKVPPVV